MSDEEAKATQEVAKAYGKTVDAASDLGRFLGRIFGAPADALGDWFGDEIKARHARRLLRLQQRYEEERAKLGAGEEVRPVSTKFGVALITAAAQEDNDDLQDLFARLLARATTDGTGVESDRHYVSIIQDMTPLDAEVLKAISDAPQEHVITANLPLAYLDCEFSDAPLPPANVERSLWKLQSLGLISGSASFDEDTTMKAVKLSALGAAFIQACTMERQGK